MTQTLGLDYQKTVKGCAYLLEEAFAEQNIPAADIRVMVDKIRNHAWDVYCKHLMATICTTGKIGHITRMKAVGRVVAAIEKLEKARDPDSKTHVLFRAMNAIYAKPEENIDYFDRGAFGLVANMFYAAANELGIEDKYVEDFRKRENDTAQKPIYY